MQANQFNQYGSEVLAVDSKLIQATRELRALDAQHVQLKNTAQMVDSALASIAGQQQSLGELLEDVQQAVMKEMQGAGGGVAGGANIGGSASTLLSGVQRGKNEAASVGDRAVAVSGQLDDMERQLEELMATTKSLAGSTYAGDASDATEPTALQSLVKILNIHQRSLEHITEQTNDLHRTLTSLERSG
ncbi:Charged multivesicular body protein 3 [Perkinsus olseni]|uniref:Charged multivesicular body protein 3 n=1 Tax=Perkinsus olseni TaxID=32597 RepID=A0A7J6THG9_PEROL|nr:Charged multivesicular body protein 3 [Perkinsus olseni]